MTTNVATPERPHTPVKPEENKLDFKKIGLTVAGAVSAIALFVFATFAVVKGWLSPVLSEIGHVLTIVKNFATKSPLYATAVVVSVVFVAALVVYAVRLIKEHMAKNPLPPLPPQQPKPEAV